MKSIILLLLNLGGLVSGLEKARPRTARPTVYHRFEAAHEPLIKDEYLVMLHDHPLEDHFAFIGTNLSETASYFHPYSNIMAIASESMNAQCTIAFDMIQAFASSSTTGNLTHDRTGI